MEILKVLALVGIGLALAHYAWVVLWAYGDARGRGRRGGYAAGLVGLLWPVGLQMWRKQRPKAGGEEDRAVWLAESAALLWLAVAVGPGLFLIGNTMGVWPGGRSGLLVALSLLMFWSSLLLISFLIGTALVAVALTAVAVFSLRGPWKVPNGLSGLVACVGLCVVCVAAHELSREVRRDALVGTAEAGGGINAALAGFHRDRGEYPDDLQLLVPRYLEEVPGTGLIGYPDFYYARGAARGVGGEAGYELGIRCGSELTPSEVFFCWPSGEYPTAIYGGPVERIGTWAYVRN